MTHWNIFKLFLYLICYICDILVVVGHWRFWKWFIEVPNRHKLLAINFCSFSGGTPSPNEPFILIWVVNICIPHPSCLLKESSWFLVLLFCGPNRIQRPIPSVFFHRLRQPLSVWIVNTWLLCFVLLSNFERLCHSTFAFRDFRCNDLSTRLSLTLSYDWTLLLLRPGYRLNSFPAKSHGNFQFFSCFPASLPSRLYFGFKILFLYKISFPSTNILPGREKKCFCCRFDLRGNIFKQHPSSHEKRSVKRIFNCRISRARRTVEIVVGILSAAFRVLRKPILLEP